MSVCLICFATDLNVDADTREVLAILVLRLFFDLFWWKRAVLGPWGDWGFWDLITGNNAYAECWSSCFFCLCACADGLPDLLQWGMQNFLELLAQTVAFNCFLISLSSLVMSFYVDGVVSLKICFLLFTLFSVFLAETHGTCAYPEIQDEYDYFSTALYLYSKYNVTVSHLSSQQHHARCTRYVRL